MDVRLRKSLAIVTDPTSAELAAWLAQHEGHVFKLSSHHGEAYFKSLGEEDAARNLPVNVTSKSPGELRWISNFAQTPFVLDDLAYESVEGFWQGLKFPEAEQRRALAALHGSEAKDAGFHAPAADVIIYGDELVRVGTWDHWQLMARACAAKFEQHARAQAALLSTGERPLVHRMKRDSRTIPGVIMAEIWMRCRDALRKSLG